MAASSKGKGRKSAYRAVGSLYRRANVPLDRCCYCGDIRECLNHCPPLSVAADLDLDEYRARGGKLLLYPSCNACNAALGARHYATLAECVAALHGMYSAKLERESGLWSKEEIAELGYNLRMMAKARAAKTKELIRKLRGVEHAICSLRDEDYE